jgi:glycosyltransferase involved in cell wall biosynthesis
LPPHIYNNDRRLNIEEVCKKINQSNCGLMLSALEGACFSSSEYLLCGIPVVSTRSSGGRDFWYNDYNSIICDDDEDSVAKGVEFFKNNPRDGERIRKDHILLAQKQREKFITILQSVFNKYKVQINSKDYFEKNYFHKMRNSVHVDEVKNIFL